MSNESLNKFALALGALLGLFVLIVIARALIRRQSPEPVAVATIAGSPLPTFAIPPSWTVPPAAPTGTPEPTIAPSPTAPPTATQAPIDALRAALEDRLSGDGRIRRAETMAGLDTLYVDWNINEALSDEGLRRNAKVDAVSLLRVVAENSDGLAYKDVALSGYFPLVDNLGNTQETMVVQVWYDRATIEQINFDNFYDQLYTSAKNVRFHTIFEE